MGLCATGSDTHSMDNSESVPARARFEKAPGAPKRFKSAFIFFSSEQHPQIRSQLGEKGAKEKTTNVAKLVSEAWKNLSPTKRGVYEEMSRLDKMRYEMEKKNYKGPWKILKERKWCKDPDAPKRPMSAFLMYSNGKRAAVKQENPALSNADISRFLAERWRSAPAEERQIFIDQELIKRQEYKVKLVKWRDKQSLEQATAAECAMVAPQLASSQPSYFSAMGVNSVLHGGLPYAGTSSWLQSTPGHDRAIPLPTPPAAYPENFRGANSNAFSYVNTDTSAYYSQAYPFGMYNTDTEAAAYAQAGMNQNAALQSQYQAQDYAAAAQQYYRQQHPFQYGSYGGGEPALTVHDFASYAAAVAPQGNHPSGQQYFDGSDSYLDQEPRR